MNPKILLRIASFLILFHAVGHTFGMQTRKNVQDPPAKALIQTMSEVKVPMMGKMTNRSYDDFYYGMGIALSVALLSITILLWILGGIAVSNPQNAKNLLYPILFNLSGLAVIEFVYFFPLPAWTSTLSSICIVLTLIRLGKK